MSTFLLIVTVVLWIALRTHAAKAKRNAETEDAAPRPSQPSYGSVRSAFESLFDDEEREASAAPSFSQEEAQAGYYSYESMDEPEESPIHAKVDPTLNSTEAVKAVETLDGPKALDFDLRQAIIYQTILSNKYLNEMHSTEN